METNKNLLEHLEKVIADEKASVIHRSGARLMHSIHDEFTKWRLADIERVSAEDLAHAWVTVIAHMSLQLVYELAGPEDLLVSSNRLGEEFHREILERSFKLLIEAEMREN